jgi:ribose 5-phosphate isomerase B
MKIILAADHGGFKLKEEAKHWLKEMHLPFKDFGALHFDSEDDYPDFAWPAAIKVGQDREALGIFFCRSGHGVCIVANKAKGARAALCFSEKSAEDARHDDDANILCVPSDYLTVDSAKKIISAFVKTKFSREEKHARRVGKIKKIDINL